MPLKIPLHPQSTIFAVRHRRAPLPAKEHSALLTAVSLRESVTISSEQKLVPPGGFARRHNLFLPWLTEAAYAGKIRVVRLVDGRMRITPGEAERIAAMHNDNVELQVLPTSTS